MATGYPLLHSLQTMLLAYVSVVSKCVLFETEIAAVNHAFLGMSL